jgi:hypothetical protein
MATFIQRDFHLEFPPSVGTPLIFRVMYLNVKIHQADTNLALTTAGPGKRTRTAKG